MNNCKQDLEVDVASIEYMLRLLRGIAPYF